MSSFSHLFATFRERLSFEIFSFFSEVSEELRKRLTSLTPLSVNTLHLLLVANYNTEVPPKAVSSVQPEMDVHSKIVKPGPSAIT